MFVLWRTMRGEFTPNEFAEVGECEIQMTEMSDYQVVKQTDRLLYKFSVSSEVVISYS